MTGRLANSHKWPTEWQPPVGWYGGMVIGIIVLTEYGEVIFAIDVNSILKMSKRRVEKVDELK